MTSALVAGAADLRRHVLAQTTTDGALGAVATCGLATVPGVTAASITRYRDTGLQSVGATGPDVARLDGVQYESGRGPVFDVVTADDGVLVVPDLAADPRYPQLATAAAAAGLVGLLTVRLAFAPGDLRASLTLWSTEVDAFDDAAQTTGLLFAETGALAVSCVVAREQAVNLERALVSSRTIGTAVGILMASKLLDADRAFDALRIASQTRNRKVAEVAATVVETGSLDVSAAR